MDFKIGDKVDVIDLRDSAVVAEAVTISSLTTVQPPGRSQPIRIAILSNGFGVPARCLRPVNKDRIAYAKGFRFHLSVLTVAMTPDEPRYERTALAAKATKKWLTAFGYTVTIFAMKANGDLVREG